MSMKIIYLLDQMNIVEVEYFEIRKNEKVLFRNNVDLAIQDYYLENETVKGTAYEEGIYKRNMKLLDCDFSCFRFENVEIAETVKAKKIIIFIKTVSHRSYP